MKAFHNNYGRPVIGWPDDFERLGRREVRLLVSTGRPNPQCKCRTILISGCRQSAPAAQVADFYRRHYGPSSLTISIVGDVKPSQVGVLCRSTRHAAPIKALECRVYPLLVCTMPQGPNGILHVTSGAAVCREVLCWLA